jgi:hypothetical protein
MCTIPDITRRSSTHRAPGWFFGKCGSIAAHAASDNQNNDPAMPRASSTGDSLNQHTVAESSF